jgi:hypothetical protein
MMRCPKCGHEFANPTAQAGGRAGGAARVAKGFASPAVQAKAMATRRRKARAKRSPNNAVRGAAKPRTVDAVLGKEVNP